MAHAVVNTTYPLRLQMANGNATVFPRAQVFSPAGASLGFAGLSHISGGLYGAPYTFASTGSHVVVYQIFADAGFVSPTGDDKEVAEVEVTETMETQVWEALLDNHLGAGTVGEAVAIVRGLMQHNYILDNTSYNAKGLLVGGRIRVFRNAADTIAEVSPLASFTIAGTAELSPDDNLGQKLRVTRDP